MAKQPLLLPDGEPVSCHLMMRDDAPIFWARCEKLATDQLPSGEVVRFRQWRDEHPKAVIRLYPGEPVYLCETHTQTVREVL